MCWLRDGYLTLPRVLIGKGRKGLTFEMFWALWMSAL